MFQVSATRSRQKPSSRTAPRPRPASPAASASPKADSQSVTPAATSVDGRVSSSVTSRGDGGVPAFSQPHPAPPGASSPARAGGRPLSVAGAGVPGASREPRDQAAGDQAAGIRRRRWPRSCSPRPPRRRCPRSAGPRPGSGLPLGPRSGPPVSVTMPLCTRTVTAVGSARRICGQHLADLPGDVLVRAQEHAQQVAAADDPTACRQRCRPSASTTGSRLRWWLFISLAAAGSEASGWIVMAGEVISSSAVRPQCFWRRQ